MRQIITTTLLLLICSMPLAAQQLVDSEYLGDRSKEQLQQDFGPLIQNGIEMYKLTYTTPDINGQTDTASGLLVLPVRDELLAYPLLCYQHGTVGEKSDVPSNLAGGWELAAVWSGLGYVAAAPDFLGLGESRGFHPYVHADTEASAGRDMMRAAREFCEGNATAQINDQVFITGYSQGGHAAAALQRLLEAEHAEEFPVTAAAPMSGPYSISGEMLKVILQEAPYFFPSYLPYTALSYNEVYGLFAEVEDYFVEPYASAIQEFYEGSRTLSNLNDFLIDELTANEGASITRYMMQDSLINVLESGDPSHPIIQALQDNDVYDWAPQAPTRLYYCTADDQVVYTNSLVADSVMNANGANDVASEDVGPMLDHGQCVEPAVAGAAFFFLNFQEILVNTGEDPAPMRPFELMPNPASEQVRVAGLPGEGRLQLINSSGQVLRSWEALHREQTLSVAGLPAGVYLLRLDSEAGIRVEKLLIR